MALPGRSLTIAPSSPTLAAVDIEQGIAMDGDELGDLGDILTE